MQQIVTDSRELSRQDKRPVMVLLAASLSQDPFPISPPRVWTLRRPFGLLFRQRRILLSPVSLWKWEVREITGRKSSKHTRPVVDRLNVLWGSVFLAASSSKAV